jgi:gamma-glutamyl hercynylcysteine S-oxide synthase
MNDINRWIAIRDGHGRTLEVQRFPVTVLQTRQFLAANGYDRAEFWSDEGWRWRQSSDARTPSYWSEVSYTTDDYFPVTGVCYWEAEAIARFLGGRLPLESEWWWIATNCGHTAYPWGNAGPDSTRVQSTFFGIMGTGRVSRVDAHPAGKSKFEIADLLGNVAEWCTPSEGADEGMAVLRGGASWHPFEVLDNQFRDIIAKTVRDNNTGIRVVRGETVVLNAMEVSSSIASGFQGQPSLTFRKIERPTDQMREEGEPRLESLDQKWNLTVDGLVRRPRQFSLAQLTTEFDVVSEVGVLVCVCKWLAKLHVKGVRLFDVIRACEPLDGWEEAFLNFSSFPGKEGRIYETSWQIASTLDHGPLLVFDFDGKPLQVKDGAPLRTLDWHTYGYKHVKAINHINVAEKPRPGHWETSKGYSFDGIVQPGSYTLIGEMARKMALTTSGRVAFDEEVRRD